MVVTQFLRVWLMAASVLPLAAATGFETNARRPFLLTDPAVIAANLLPDYSYAGYRFGLAPIPSDPGTTIRVIDHGVVPDDGKDDAKAVLKALAAAERVQGRVTIRFPKGRVQIGEIIPVERSDIILDGAGEGEGGTELYFPRPLKIVDTSDRQDEIRAYMKREDKFERQPDQNIDFLFSEYSWSGGFIMIGPKQTRPVSYDDAKDRRPVALADIRSGRQFDRTVTVASPRALRVGQVIQLQWFATQGANSAILKSLYGDIDTWNAAQADPKLKLSIGSHHWTFAKRPAVAQSTRIVAISGNRITLGDPLLHDVAANQPAQIAAWEHLSNVGVQNLRFTFPYSPWFGHHLEQGYNALYITGVFDGWARNLAIENSDSAILTDNAASLTIANVTTSGNHKAHYSVHVGAVHNVLVKDLRVENPVIHPLSVNTRSTRSVYQRATVLRDAIIDQHSGSNHQNLFDQITMNVKPNKSARGWSYALWVAGGAPYWKPGHGLMNAHWNIRLNVEDGLAEGQTVRVFSGLEGPGARIVGLHANRTLVVDHKPTAYIEGTNRPVAGVPSLYDYQLAKRRRN